MFVRTTQIDIMNGFSDCFAVRSPNRSMILVWIVRTYFTLLLVLSVTLTVVSG